MHIYATFHVHMQIVSSRQPNVAQCSVRALTKCTQNNQGCQIVIFIGLLYVSLLHQLIKYLVYLLKLTIYIIIDI
jgi:hypothetical protein